MPGRTRLAVGRVVVALADRNGARRAGRRLVAAQWAIVAPRANRFRGVGLDRAAVAVVAIGEITGRYILKVFVSLCRWQSIFVGIQLSSTYI